MTTCETCRKVEDALNMLKTNNPAGFNIYYFDHNKEHGTPKLLKIALHDKPDGKEVAKRSGVNWCDIPKTLVELAKELFPPKPEDRKWRSGDLVMLTARPYQKLLNDTPYELLHFLSWGAKWRLKGHGNHYHDKKDFRNISIEAEQAGGG